MRKLETQERESVSGGACDCTCLVEKGHYGPGGWVHEGWTRHPVGVADNVLQCTQACQVQNGVGARAECAPRRPG